jgi:hypothetical protein
LGLGGRRQRQTDGQSEDSQKFNYRFHEQLPPKKNQKASALKKNAKKTINQNGQVNQTTWSNRLPNKPTRLKLNLMTKRFGLTGYQTNRPD